ncbi:MAG TPA: transposase [Candidatus Paceibacterota bacterium]|nr:transposase [Candidatus Paceibacterota bacterium]
MAIRKTSLAIGEFFHIYNRGNDKRIIFDNDDDYRHFVKLLYASNSKDGFVLRDMKKNIFDTSQEDKIVSIGAWCLMPNHFHLILTPIDDDGISKFMQKLSTAYSMYYNGKYKRSGSLFQGKFKSQHTENDRYLKYLFSYVHLNPVKIIQKDWKEKGIENKQKAISFLESYKYSSYMDYLGVNRLENKILDKKAFPEYFSSSEKIKDEIFDWISFDK